MSLYYRQLDSAIIVYGNTYAVRDRLKAMGGRWSGAEKNWRLPNSDENLTLVDGMCAAYGGVRIGGPVAELAPREGAGAQDARAEKPSDLLTINAFTPDAADALSGLTIRQLMDKASLAINQAFPVPVWVVGEVQNLAKRPSGIFFELAESADQSTSSASNGTVTVKAILWNTALAGVRARRGAQALEDVLADGMKVRVLCQVQLYRDRGHVSLLVDDIDPAYTKGALALEREKLLKELRAKGLDEAQRKLPRPSFPFLVGLVSSPGSRAASDFLDQLASLKFPGEVIFHAAPMQGEAVPERVARAIATLEAYGVDLIVVTRGGGSAADLRWFDAAEIAYAIAGAKVPVIAAIGHHDDTVVAEMICHERQKTPTAAADFVAQIFAETRQRVDRQAGAMAQSLTRRGNELAALQAQLSIRLAQAAESSLNRRDGRLRDAAHRLESEALGQIAAHERTLLARGAEIGRLAERALASKAEALFTIERALAGKDPKPWLKAGWTRLTLEKSESGRQAVLTAKTLAKGMRLTARLADGKATLIVDDIEMKAGPPPG